VIQVFIKRLHFRKDGVFSTLRCDDINLVTIEHAYDDGINSWEPKVPAGTYKAIRRLSPRFQYEVFCLQDVPGCDFIEMHIGNYNDDSTGCFCIGKEIDLLHSPAMVTRSRDALLELMDYLFGQDEIEVVVC
jgi:hypothetical protein